MRYEMKAIAYDCMDHINIAVSLRVTEDDPALEPQWISLASSVIRGSGVTDRREWVQDALIALLEAL